MPKAQRRKHGKEAQRNKPQARKKAKLTENGSSRVRSGEQELASHAAMALHTPTDLPHRQGTVEAMNYRKARELPRGACHPLQILKAWIDPTCHLQ